MSLTLLMVLISARVLPLIISSTPTTTKPEQQHQLPKQDTSPTTITRPNFLMIIVDDLRWTNINIMSITKPNKLDLEGGRYTKTPNLESFAKTATKFNKAFANVPWCGPSRASFLSGREPTQTKCYSLFDGGFRQTAGPMAQTWQTLPEYLKNKGYETYTAGKVFHPGQDDDDSPRDWTGVLLKNVNESDGYILGNCKSVGTRPDTSWKILFKGDAQLDNRLLAPSTCRSSADINQFDDFLIANAVVTKLHELGQQEKKLKKTPFFIAVGFLRPHSPWHIHDNFWSLYSSDTKFVADPPILTPPIPKGYMPPLFAIPPDEYSSRKIPNVYNGIAPTNFRRGVRLAYAVAISQMDSALGQVLNTLHLYPSLEQNTVVILFGDNGFSLGESSLWFKQLLTDHSTRIPLMMRIPFLNRYQSVENQTFVELVDIYPTIMELAGFPGAITTEFPGKSLVPVYVNGYGTGLTNEQKTKNFATSIIPRCHHDRNCKQSLAVTQFGFSIRTLSWRYNVWLASDLNNRAIWRAAATTIAGESSNPIIIIIGEELYGHDNDEVEENLNLAYLKKYNKIKLDLFKKLENRFGKWGCS
jgi:iduronate 2-sulfatase